MKQPQEEVGDLFVSETSLSITVKLYPSRKTASRPIRWFAKGVVTNHRQAVRDIASLVERLQGKSRVVRGLTVMTDRGANHDITTTGLPEAVQKAGFESLN